MTGALLRSGKISSFKALGKAGQPVHRVALQLRNTISRKSKVAADCLAIPQPDQQGDNIDWYSPVAGDVISWGAATDLEREAALFRLEAVKSELTNMRKGLLPSETEQAEQNEPANKDKHVFAELLEYVIRFPDQDFVYLVRAAKGSYQFTSNAQSDQWSNIIPVLTFWGFVHADDMLGNDPLYCLYPQKSAPPLAAPMVAATIAPTATAAISDTVPPDAAKKIPWWQNWRRWLWWLLPLLLLLLMLFFFRGCTPTLPSLGMGAPSLPALPSIPTSKPRLPALPKGEFPSMPTAPVGVVNVPSIPNGGLGSIPSLPSVGSTNTGNLDMPNLPEVGEGSAMGEQSLPAEGLEVLAVNDELAATDSANAVDASPNPSNGPQDQPAVTSPALPEGQPELPGNLTSVPLAEGLSIPAQAQNGNSVDFLNGHWKAKGGIQDQRTGKPLQLEYQFDDGQGEVTIRRNDGVSCTGPVSATMNSGSLGINSQGQAKCSDGSSYEMPAVKCQQGAKSMADCAGSYGNTTFPMTMRNAGA